MLVDARTLASGESLTADVCIVGAGPAGISVARRLADSGRRIVLAESGGLEPDAATQSLSDGELVGLQYPLRGSRLRYLGGATNHWAGTCRALDFHDFETRDWLPYSGWPIRRADLDPYYRLARNSCDIGEDEPGPAAYEAAGGASPLPWHDPIRNAFWQMGPPTRFGLKYLGFLRSTPNITVLLHANLTAMTVRDGQIISAGLRTLSGRTLAVGASRYVISCGGIENARLLLAMGTERYPQGIGNTHDLVGRFFMEHPEVVIGSIVHNRPGSPAPGYFAGFPDRGRVVGGMMVSPEAQRAERIASAAFFPLIGVNDIGATPLPPQETLAMQDASTVSAGSDPRGPRQFTTVTVTFEQVPDRASRVTLGDTTDALGMRRARLDWRLNMVDRRTFATAVRLLAVEAGRQRIGRLWLRSPFRGLIADPKSTPALTTHIGWGSHHMGTTRMHEDPRQGVVNGDCRVHGLSNLFIAGSSVFPTGGVSNPTLTIVALALRLADHLRAL